MNELIEIKELRIGNLLSYDNQIVHVTSLSLDIDDEYEDQIGFCKLGSVSNEIAAWNRSLVDKLAPIPLTVDIMAKCGFNWNADNEVYYIQVGNTLYLELDTDFICSVVPESWRGQSLTIWGNVKHLHQIQNLYFALTGEELKINQ